MHIQTTCRATRIGSCTATSSFYELACDIVQGQTFQISFLLAGFSRIIIVRIYNQRVS